MLATRQAPRRELALRLGATHAVDPAAGDAIAAVTGDRAGGASMWRSNAPGCPRRSRNRWRWCGAGGAAVLFGVMAQGRRVAVEPFDLLLREVRLEAAYLNPHTHGRAAAMIAAGQLQLDPLISRSIGLDELPGELAASRASGEVKVMVRPNG